MRGGADKLWVGAWQEIIRGGSAGLIPPDHGAIEDIIAELIQGRGVSTGE